MAFPAEIYAFGINFVFSLTAILLVTPLVTGCVLPVFYENNVSTCYEYLELRFDRATRQLATLAFIGSYLMFLPIFLFLPSYAFSQVTNFNAHLINMVMHVICAFYTMIGGIKAVVWTDVVQGAIMITALLYVGIMGITKVGGLAEAFRIAGEGHRLDVDFTFDLETRATIWNSFLNFFILVASYVGFNQSAVQRLISLPTLQQSKRSMFLFMVLYLLVSGLNCFIGIIMYAYYYDCDPILTGQVQKHDKLVPFFVQDIAGNIYGVPGLFISGVFSAALSTASAAFNSLAGVVYFDYVKPFIRHTDKKANFITKLIVLGFSTYSIIGGFVIDKFPSVVQLYSIFNSLFFGAVFSCFVLGLLVPKVHEKAIFWGMIVSIAAMLVFVSCAQGKVHYKPLSGTNTDGCRFNYANVSSATKIYTEINTPSNYNNFNILKMSFNWYIVMGALIVCIVSIPLSYIIPKKASTMYNRKLLAPIVRRFIKYELSPQNDVN